MMQHHLFFWIEFRNWRHTVDTFVFNLEITSQTTSGEWEEDSSSRDTHTHTLTQCSIGTDGLATEIDQEKYLSWNTASGTTKK